MNTHIWKGAENCENRNIGPWKKKETYVFLLSNYIKLRNDHRTYPPKKYFTQMKKNPWEGSKTRPQERPAAKAALRSLPPRPTAFTPGEENTAFPWQLNLPSAAFGLEDHILHALRRPSADAPPPTPFQPRPFDARTHERGVLYGAAVDLFDFYLLFLGSNVVVFYHYYFSSQLIHPCRLPLFVCTWRILT